MITSELSHARRDEIAARLAAGTSVVAATLAVEFDVSEDAIRRDLRALAAEGRCRRVYGGALPISPATSPLAMRSAQDLSAKRALARAGAAAVRPGEFLFIDSGSTNLALIDALPDDAELTVATNAPDIAAAALRRGDLSVLVVGGAIDPVVGGCTDAVAVQAIVQMRFDRAFIGACSVWAEDGIGAFRHADAIFKRVVIAQSERVAVLATTDKLGTRAQHHVAALDQVGLLVIEDSATAAQRAALDAGGCRHLVIATR